MASSSTPKAGNGAYRLAVVAGQQPRVWVSTGSAGFMLFEAQYRAMGYSPLFEALPTKKEWQAGRAQSLPQDTTKPTEIP